LRPAPRWARRTAWEPNRAQAIGRFDGTAACPPSRPGREPRAWRASLGCDPSVPYSPVRTMCGTGSMLARGPRSPARGPRTSPSSTNSTPGRPSPSGKARALRPRIRMFLSSCGGRTAFRRSARPAARAKCAPAHSGDGYGPLGRGAPVSHKTSGIPARDTHRVTGPAARSRCPASLMPATHQRPSIWNHVPTVSPAPG